MYENNGSEMDSRAQVKPKLLCKDLAPQVVPDCTPEVEVGEYFLLKSEERLSKKKPEWDWPPLSPATELVAAYRDLEVANRNLNEKWAKGKEKQEQMDKEWDELRENEKHLRESFTRFNKFLQVNREKRERAESKIQEEKAVQKQRKKETVQLQEKLEGFIQIKKTLEEHVNKHKIYEDFLDNVVGNTVFRYETLSASLMELTDQQWSNLATLENAYNHTVRLTEEKSQLMLGLSNRISDLQSHYDQAKAETFRWETALSHIEDINAEKHIEINEVRTSCWNMYRDICRRKNMPVKTAERDVEQQLIHIKHTIQALKKIVHIVRQRAILDTASNI
ncbi:coiled-coil domain-containing protein 42 homolog [Zootermopsis nevadensis]|nr:coiled-coil domain-containing protein 42 homolog [Zootermopsis nevadensis]